MVSPTPQGKNNCIKQHYKNNHYHLDNYKQQQQQIIFFIIKSRDIGQAAAARIKSIQNKTMKARQLEDNVKVNQLEAVKKCIKKRRSRKNTKSNKT